MAMAVNRAIVLCDASELVADAATVDSLARMQLTARRHGAEIRLVDASEDLLGLIALMGLQDVLREQASGVDAGWQAE
jgi:ABC-type transporter Mla MlaB component